jgi:hypothetical protein
MLLRFDLTERADRLLDPEGIELADIEEARNCAKEAILEIVATQMRDGYLDMSTRIDVISENEKIVLSVSFSDIVALGSA